MSDPVRLQSHRYFDMLSTTGAVTGTSVAFTLPASSSVNVKARIAAYESTGPAGAGFEVEACYVRGAAGGPTLIGAVLAVITGQVSTALIGSSVTFVVSSNTIALQVTGVAAKTIKWGIVIEPLIHTP